MFDAAHFEPFLLGCRVNETLEISARVQALSAPVCRGEEGRLHLGPIRHAGLPVGIGIELARDAILVEIAAIATELLFRERLGPRYPVAVHAALEAASAAAILHGVDLRPGPILHETAIEDSAMVRHVAIEIGGAFPNADCREMLRLQRRGLPLVLAVIRNSIETDLAVRPGLHARPPDENS